MSFLDTLIYGYRTILDAGAEVTQRSKLNFVGATVADNPVTNATDITVVGGTVPTGTGVPKIVGGVQNAAASLVLNADVDPAAAIAVSKLAAGTNTHVLTTTAGVPVWAAPSGGSVPTGTGFYTVTGGVADGASAPYAAGVLSFLATPSSANLRTMLTDESGTGEAIFSTTPTFKTSVKVNNPANTFAYTFTPAAIAANRTLTLPLLAGNDTMVCEAFAQTLTNKTIAAGSNTITALANANIDAAAAIAGTKIAPDFGAQTVATSGHYKTSGTVATVGQFRLAHGDKISYRNSGNSADATFFHTAGDTGYLGLNSGFTETAYQYIFCPSQTIYIGVASNYFLIVNNNLLELNAPMLGYSGAEFGLHGAVVSAMVDADYTAATADKRVETVSITFLMTAGRTITFPHPSSMDRSYKKMIRNEASTTQTITISTGTGTTLTLATGYGQWVEFTTGGVRKAGDAFTL